MHSISSDDSYGVEVGDVEDIYEGNLKDNSMKEK